MPTYTFTPSSSYALSTHEVSFTKNKIKIKLTSSGQLVYDGNYSNGIAIFCEGNNFQIGTLSAQTVFINQVDMGNQRAGMWLVENSGANMFIGSDDSGDPGIYHQYNLNQCPVLLAVSGSYTEIKCPCDSGGSPCSNACYTYGD